VESADALRAKVARLADRVPSNSFRTTGFSVALRDV
jgi:hypothetical protein